MLKVAMLSQWHVHAKGYANEFNQSGRAKIVAVWDEEPERGKAFAESLDCPFYENLDELLASDIDAVCVTTPTTMHRDVIAKAVKAGKHIFTEKVLAPTVAECLDVKRAVEEAGVKVMTCGTCLNHYGLTEELAVGTVTNMYVIAETMTGADLIVKP